MNSQVKRHFVVWTGRGVISARLWAWWTGDMSAAAVHGWTPLFPHPHGVSSTVIHRVVHMCEQSSYGFSGSP